MKKLFVILSLMICIFTFGACSSASTPENSCNCNCQTNINGENNMNDDENNTQQEPNTPIENNDEQQVEPISSLIGMWKEIGGRSTDEHWHEAIVTNDTIELYYCDWNGKRDLYWKGSYEDPENPITDWKFESRNLDEKVDWELHRFHYTNGKLIPQRLPWEPSGDGVSEDGVYGIIYLTKIN